MADMMTFPETWEEFEKSYGFVDDEEAYTNGSRLIPSFRVKQWLDHIAHLESKRQATVSSDCIIRQAAIDAFWKLEVELRPSAIDAVLDMLKNLPSAEPGQIHCYECKYYDTQECMGRNAFYGLKDDDYCSWAELGDEQEE